MQKQTLRYLSTVSRAGHMLTSSVGVVCTIATCVLFAGPLLCVQSDPDTEKGDSPHHRNAKDFGEKQQSGLSKDFEDSAMDYDNESETFNLNLTMKDILKGFRVGATDSSSDSLFHSDYSEEVTGRSGGFDSSKKYKNNRVLINRTHSPLTNKQNSFIEKQSSQTPVQKYGNTEKDHSVTFDTSMDASSNRNRVKFTHVAYSTLHKTDGGSDYPDQSLIQKRRHKSHRILSSHRQTVENSRDVSVVTKKDSTKLSLTNTYSVQRRRGNERNNTEHTESQTQAEPRNASTKNAASSNLGTGYFRLNSTVSLNQNTPEDDNKHQEKASSNDTALFNEKRTSSNQQEIFQNPQLIHSEPGQSGSNNPQPTLISSNGSVSEFTHVSEPTNHVTSSVANSSAQPVRVQQLRSNVTNLLNMLMMGYDKRLRPDFGGRPLIVKADIEIRSMGPISEKDMIYSMDCYFRQVWTDRRLSFNASVERVANVSLNVKMLERIWHPDTIFTNGGPSYVHTITTPNKFFRLSHDGTILYSQRLTIKASCPMHLEKFPMDTQKCPLHIASFGYPVTDVIYEWHYGNELAAVASNDMRLSQFDLTGMPASNMTRMFKGTQHSILTVYFDFRRHTGYFLLQIYFPCTLLVVLSWVSFYINREATSDRINLGVTTMLTMTFLVLDSRNDLPKVAYSTALDVYVCMCFFFIFASIVQFAAVHFFTKYGTADPELLQHIADTDEDEDVDDDDDDDGDDDDGYPSYGVNHKGTRLQSSGLSGCLKTAWRCVMSTRRKRFNKNVRNSIGLNSVSKIDKVARILFPAAFSGLNIIYWMSYLR